VPEHFCSIFPRRDQFIWKLPGQGWKKANGPLLDHQILGVVSDEGRGLFRGCYWSHKTSHAVLDIDAGSKYHNAAELQKLQEKLAAVGLKGTPFQSSDSGGWHLYLFLDDWEDSSQVEQTLKSWLKAQGYKIECGQLEVFPSGNALRLPLQKGFGWLDPEGNLVRRREEIRVDDALASFLCDLEENKRNWSEAKSRIESQISSAGGAASAGVQAHKKAIEVEGFEGLWNSGQIPERIEEARYYLNNGLTEEGQSHAAIYSIQHLLWFGDRARAVPRLPGTHNDEKRWRFIKEWLEKNHNGRSWNINRGNWRVLDGHIRRAAEWRRQDHQPVAEYVPYMVTERAEDAMIGLTKKTGHLFTPADLERANQKREARARESIREAVQLFIKAGRKLSIKGLARVSGCDRKTVRRHSDIHRISPVVVLSKWGGDIDPGGVGGVVALGCSGTCPEEREISFPEIQGDPRRVVVDSTGSTVLAAVAEESFLPSVLVGDSRQTEFSCIPEHVESDQDDLEPTASLCSAEAPPSPPQAAATLRLVADSALCLLSCADRQVATVRESDGMEAPESLASPSRTQPSTGSKHWLGGTLGTCGLNGFLPSSAEPPLGPLQLNPREIFSKGSGSVMLQDGGSSSGRCPAPVVEEGRSDRGGLVCYTNATVSGIKEKLGATSGEGVLSSFGAERKNKKTVPDATNYKFLTMRSCGYSSHFADEFSLIVRSHGRGPSPVPVSGAASSLFVISQTYRLAEKQTSLVDVTCISLLGEVSGVSLHQPTASAPESTSACLQCGARLFRFSVVPQVPRLGACPSCRQLLDNDLQVSSGSRIRGPPKCIQRMKSQSTHFTSFIVEERAGKCSTLKVAIDGLYTDSCSTVPLMCRRLHQKYIVAVDACR